MSATPDLSKLLVVLVLLAHLAVPVLSLRSGWSLSPVLWLLRFDGALLLVLVLPEAMRAGGDLAGPALVVAVGAAALLGGSFLPLPAGLAWTLYALATLVAAFVGAFALFFRMTRLF